MYSDATLTQIRNATSIVEVVGEYVSLKKSGQGFSGLCPFHNEKTPSFHVHPLKQMFHCFGCHKGGNVFSFLCAIEGLSFPEAVQKLAKRAGIEPQEEGPRSHRAIPEPQKNNPRLTAALEWAAKYFHYLLMENPEYRYVQEYLTRRGISQKSVERFRIGVSPKGWSTLLDLMLKRNFTFEELVQAGLVVAKEGSPTRGYDRFRQRLMFPIRDTEGNVIGFGARLLADEPNQPKYLNSPESPLFSKRHHLYGLYENQRGIRVRGEAIIVEGYMDVVGLSEHEVNSAIATMGTALTEEHCGVLKNFCNRVVTVFDADAGGQDAWRRSVHLFLSSGIFAKDLSLPTGKDPDEFIQTEGAESFYKLCEKAPRQITKLLKEIASEGSLSEEARAKCLEELTPILIASRRLPDRAFLWDDISLVLKVSLEALKELSEPAYNKPKVEPAKSPALAIRPAKTPPARAEKKPDVLDVQFFNAVVKDPKPFFEKSPEAWKGGIREVRIGRWLERLYAGGEKAMPHVLEELVQEENDPVLQSAASGKLIQPEVQLDKSEIGLVELLMGRLQQRQREREIKALTAQIKLSERLGDTQEGIRLLERLKALRSS